MKLKTFTLLLLITFVNIYSQSDDLLTLAKRNQVNKVISLKDSLTFKKIYNNYINDTKKLGNTATYNNAVLNKYFIDIITSHAKDIEDLSFTNYFINAKTSEKTLTIGKSIRFDNMFVRKKKREAVKIIRPIQKVENLLSVYVKSNLSNGFSNLYSKNSNTGEFEFNSNIGAGLKYTYICNGKMTPKDRVKINYIRENYVKNEVKSKFKKYDDNSFNKDLILSDFENKDNPAKLKENQKKQVEKKYFDFYENLIDSEIKYIKSEKLIQRSRVSWITLEAYIPLTNRIIKHSLDRTTILKKDYKDYSFKGTYNVLWTKNTKSLFKDLSIKLTLQPSIFNTNNFKINNKSANTFQTIIASNPTTNVEGNSETVFIGNYDDLWAKSMKSELVVLLFNNSIGLSGAVEFVTSDIKDYENWKLGVPFSLKDKKGKPNVNFELQWKELNKSHFVGISIGYNFGKFIK